MHHLYPLTGSVDELGKTVFPNVEIDCIKPTASDWSEPLAPASKIAPNTMHWIVTGLLGVEKPGIGFEVVFSEVSTVATLMASVSALAPLAEAVPRARCCSTSCTHRC